MKSLFFLIVSVVSGAVFAAGSVPVSDKSVCMQGPLGQFGRYVGDWIIEDWQLDQNGVDWNEGPGARWNFICLGDGTAIQDFWIPNGGSVGTNLRTWNPSIESWEIAWAITPAPGLAHIEAKMQDDGRIVMHYKAPVPDPLRRITFFPPTESGWNWKMEFSKDQGENWFEVYRIRASRAD